MSRRAKPPQPLTDAEREAVAVNLGAAYQCAHWFASSELGQRLGDADDCCQEAYFALVRATRRYDPHRGRISTLIFRAVRNHLVRVARNNGTIHVPAGCTKSCEVDDARAVAAACSDCLDRIVANRPTTAHEENAAKLQLVYAEINRLPDRERDVMLSIVRGQTLAEIGRRWKRTKQCVQVVKASAIARLKERLAA